jgi:hypothetical protein
VAYRANDTRETGIQRMTDSEALGALTALRDARRLREQLRAARGGAVLSESWPVIRDARETAASGV